MIEVKIFKTCLVLGLLFILAIKVHGDDESSDLVKGIEAIGLLACISGAFASSLVIIWS